MIVYNETKKQFRQDIFSNRIEEIVHERLKLRTHKSVGRQEIASWKNSLGYMDRILEDEDIPADSRVAIEYNIPNSSKRIDFILTGQDAARRDTALVIELKQWSEASLTSKDAVVKTYLGGHEVETSHPSYQAWTYVALLEDFNETVQNDDIFLQPCAYLHNCTSDETILDDFYKEHLEKAPVFLRDDATRLREFIKRFVKYGDSSNLMYRIDQGRIRPSKALADSLLSMLQGNTEFIMIDDQKLVYETALALGEQATAEAKQVLIVRGGPGTGKSVVAVNLLVELTARDKVVQYVTRNAAPRHVYESKLTGAFKRTHIGNMFKGSGSYTETDANALDVLVVDEGHRLNEKSGLYQNLGENQILEIIRSSKCSVFFIDEDQRVTFKDIGDCESIRQWAGHCGATVTEMELASQFRCNGSNGYLAWLDDVLQIRKTANKNVDDFGYDFRVFDDPAALRDAIVEKNRINNKARLVAGYCWPWKSKKDPGVYDIEFPEHDFAMQWNLASDGNLWILKPESVKEVGCIHTCQGLELDYIGVIVGPDLVVRDDAVQTDAGERAGQDRSVHGYKGMLKKTPSTARAKAELVIKNTYRTLMTRGQKGCYIYCTDEQTNAYFKALLSGSQQADATDGPYPNLHLRIMPSEELIPYENAVPLYDIHAAAGGFSIEQGLEETECDWVQLPEPLAAKEGLFVARVLGESMNRRIPNGAWCLFRANPTGSRQGKVVLVQHREIADVETGGHFTVKVYRSEKTSSDDGEWMHSRIILSPDTRAAGYGDIVLQDESASELRLIGELVAVLP